ncbi:MAG: alkaline phosphatase family protein, partial [Bacteroidales bacterium]|nr:alkaline phosphatase family protein [Bacteroidales bacterium]
MSISRRDFLKKGAAATVAAGALMSPLACTPAKKKLKGGNAKQVLIISFDGISIEGFEAAKTPNIDALIKSGAASMATRDVMPSITLPNYTSHLLGAGPEVHGVTDNSWTFESHSLPPVATDEDGYFPGIFKVLKDGVPGIKTAFYENW